MVLRSAMSPPNLKSFIKCRPPLNLVHKKAHGSSPSGTKAVDFRVTTHFGQTWPSLKSTVHQTRIYRV